MISFEIKPFKALSTSQLYDVLALRSEVFVVEQNCVYQDIDGKDQKAMHLLGSINDQIVAYCRIFKPGDYFENPSIGRVVVHPGFRAKQFGHDLMREAINYLDLEFPQATIEISAQSYLLGFYRAHGFRELEPSYLEDGIPHHRMFRSK